MRFAILGTRGIPARYGGFETFAEELSTRLAARGHSITVYCREKYSEPTYRGVRLKYLPTIRHKYFDTLAHTCFSTLHLAAVRGYDAVLYCNAANAVFTWIPRMLGMPVALNVDGLERHRKKWNALAKTWYRISERLATWMPNAVVTDAQSIAAYYREQYGRSSEMIPYGAEVGRGGNVRRARSAGPGASPLFPLREPHGTGEQRSAGAGSIRTGADTPSSWRSSAMRRTPRSTSAAYEPPAIRAS